MTVTKFADAEQAAIQAASHWPNSDGPSLPFTGFTDDEWLKIEATRVQRPDLDWTKVRHDLTWAGRLFWKAHGDRLWLLEVGERNRLETFLKHIREFQAGIAMSTTYWGICLIDELAELEHSLVVCQQVCRYRMSGVEGLPASLTIRNIVKREQTRRAAGPQLDPSDTETVHDRGFEDPDADLT